MIASLVLALLAGSLTTLNPCVLPLLPLVLAGAVSKNKWSPMAMGAGLAFSYAFLGLFVATVGESIGLDSDRLRWLGGVLLFLFGVVQCWPAWNDRLMLRLSQLANAAHRAAPQANGSLLSAAATGALMGLAWSPCSGPLLGGALTLVGNSGGAIQGTLILGVFGLGAAAPLVMVAYASRAQFLSLRSMMLKHTHRIKQALGLMMLLLGLAILSGYDKKLEGWLVQLMPEWLILATTRI